MLPTADEALKTDTSSHAANKPLPLTHPQTTDESSPFEELAVHAAPITMRRAHIVIHSRACKEGEPSPQTSQPPTIPPFAFEASIDRERHSTHHSLHAKSCYSQPSAQLHGDSGSESRPAYLWWLSSQSGYHYAQNDWDSASPVLMSPDEHHRHREQPPESTDLYSFLMF